MDRRRRSVWLILVVGLWPGVVGSQEGVAKGDTRRGPGTDRHFQPRHAVENERIGKSQFSDSPVAKPRDGLLRRSPETSIDLSDWDWSGVGDEPARPAPRSPAAPARPPQSRGDGTPAPDLAAMPRPAIALFAGLPPFLVVPGVRDAAMHPCGSCHRWTESDPTPRTLQEPHDRLVLRHGLRGQGRFWCFTCHQLAGDGSLRTLEGEAVGRDGAYLICAQCHADRARDWAFGAHGKRVGSWRGERRVLACTACHDPHRPAWKTRDAFPIPEDRREPERPAARHDRAIE